MKRSDILKVLGAIVFLGLFFGAAMLHRHYRGDMNLQQISMNRIKKAATHHRVVPVSVISNIGSSRLMVLEMSIPCQDEGQCIDLKRKMRSIKSDFLIQVDSEDMTKWVRNRDYGSIKIKFLQIINRHIKDRVKNLYFDSFLPL